ncbi:hypothetical protein V2A60_009897 [Cordyceps javanica]|uniref:Oryzin n=1 Tax=Cordyceps javanica TaxID=43265 RepID=A0A545VVP7_9HYPO|nr:oryzin precursor [Cordyceps javanica]TQW05764.1 oryzin precursor [Cordyceps javanica]
MRFSFLVSLLPLVAAVPAVRKRAVPAPILAPRGEPQDLVEGSYIVKFKDGTVLTDLEEAYKMLEHDPSSVYSDGVFTGFAGEMSSDSLDAIRNHPEVEYIEQVSMGSVQGYLSEGQAPWGLGRISARGPGNPDYVFDESSGEGTCSYIIDSGIDTNHPDFEGRATYLGRFGPGPDYDDCQHGTHVAGTVGSRTFGVAKKTHLYGIKVLSDMYRNGSCVGSSADMVKAVNVVARDAAGRDCPKGVVVNMSLGCPYSRALNDAVDNLVRRGIFVAVAAGNANRTASDISPASAGGACNVGGSDYYDNRYIQSNWGSSVDISAPAVNIASTLPGGGWGGMTGTSMASPHIAGLAAYLAAKDGTSGSELCKSIQQLAMKNAPINNQVQDTTNLIAFNDNPYV